MARKIMLSTEDYVCSITKTYENVAKRLNVEVDDVQFDCRKICVAENIQDAWIEFYRTKAKEENPNLGEADISLSIGTVLLSFGAKVDFDLEPNEVSVEDGFTEPL